MATLLFRKPRPLMASDKVRSGIIDIGSNSIRLVVYQGPARLPAILFNEKVLAGLGRDLAETGEISAAALDSANTALARFAAVARELAVTDLRVVATAAVRDASNGGQLIDAAKAHGLTVELLSGVEEAMASGMGVLSGMPDADGIVGDMGGGSLELVRVVAGTVTDQISFPLGVLRIGAIRAQGKGALDRHVKKLLTESGWADRGKGLPFYLVGGSWRALARLDMHLTGYPLPIVHQYRMLPASIARLGRTLSHIGKGKLKSVANLSNGRIPTLGDACALLSVVTKQLGSSEAVTSAFGLREGLLFGRLDDAQRREDPLITAARDEGTRFGRFPEHGDLLDQWIAPLFEGEAAEMARLRHAACLLADVGWRANPEFRAERGLEIALHGNWVAIEARGRGIMAQTLFTALGGGLDTPDPLGRLADYEALDEARRWGLAIRLGQRLSGGVAGPLERSQVTIDGDAVRLILQKGDRALYGEAVERRHKALASAMGRSPVVEVSRS